MKYFILNGWAAPREVWNPFLRGLAQSEAEIIQGDDFPEAVISEAVRRISAEQAEYALIGWSLGSLLLPAILAALPRQPEFIVLTGATRCFAQSADNPAGWEPEVIGLMAGSLESHPVETVRAFTEKLLSQREKAQGFGEELQQLDWGVSGKEALTAGLHCLKALNCCGDYAQLSIPVLLLHGTADRICPYPAAEKLARAVARSEMIAFNNAGHMPFYTRTGEFIDALQTFRKRICYEHRQRKTAPPVQP